MAPPTKPPFLPKEEAIRRMKEAKLISDMTWLSLQLEEVDLQTRNAPPAPFTKWGGDIGLEARLLEERAKYELGMSAGGDEAFKRGQYSDAARLYKSGTKCPMPNAETSWSNRCLALIKLKRYEAALRAYSMAGMLHHSMHGEGIDEYYVKYDYRVGLILKELGMYERAEYHLTRSLRIDPQESEVTQLALAEVKAKMEALERQYKGRRRSREELDGRRTADENFMLSNEEIDMLFAAGVMPWDHGIPNILVAGRGSDEGDNNLDYDTEEDHEKEGSMKDLIEQFKKDHLENQQREPDGGPVRHHYLMCQECSKSKAAGIKLLKCLRCGVAWVILSVTRSRGDLTKPVILQDALQQGVSKEALAISQATDRTAFERKIVIHVLEHQPKAKRTAEKFKIANTGAAPIDVLEKINPIFGTLRDQRNHRHQEIQGKRSDFLGIAMYLLIAVSGREIATNIVPVALTTDFEGEIPPPHWKEKMFWSINSGNL
ncbi:hypothetical protein FS837_008594 [Tulasnella sp. UAMH 9824]|nr:hypothetical protein FS837_008594 [Tulasnella sp. UAMH 9824]